MHGVVCICAQNAGRSQMVEESFKAMAAQRGIKAKYWGREDPGGQPIEVIRRVRFEVCRKVEVLLDEIEQRQAHLKEGSA